ncbi:bacteriophage abortive infection AbiH family protein [Bacillus cereus]|uniref:bacteriophage abortive infection AbiH family protein n=1 Tax=Bacillus cereus TaxID=1396 RepID=UPI0037F80801
MNKLFIIGNGFDLAHDIKSSYEDFKSYLESKDSDERSDWEDTMESDNFDERSDWEGETELGNDISEQSDVIFDLLIYAINEAEGGWWSNLEDTLGRINYDAFLSSNGYKNNEILLETLKTRADVFKDLLDSWVNEINIKDKQPKQDFIKLIGTNDLFFNFNYTSTLEKVYNVNKEKVFHIHGVAGEDVEFGHGAEYIYLGYEEAREVHESFRKDTGGIADAYDYYFKDLPNHHIQEIYTFGFSYGDVDQVYLKKIFKGLDVTNGITWFFNDYDKEREEEFKAILEKCGFKGKYANYSVIS